MAIELTLSNGGLLELQPGLPDNYNGPILRGAVALSAKTNFTQLVIQELAGDQYSIRFSIAKFLKKVIATGNIRQQGLYSYFMLKNGIRKEIGGLGKLHLRQDYYTCFFAVPGSCKATFEKNIEYRAIDLFYSPKLLEELLPFFPQLEDILVGSKSVMLPGKIYWTLPSMKEITNHLLSCPYDEGTRQFYFDLKVRELLYQILENAFKRRTTEYRFTPAEISRIHDVKTILEGYISKKPPSIRSLSKQVALNEFKLKTGFRQCFQTSIFEWLMEQRMQHARYLLLTTTKPIKEISSQVGYPRTTNFITAFRRRFGMTPGSLRR